MKILFVEPSEVLQSKWIEPLRKKGWGVVRARSAEDATRMMSFHGDSLEAIAVGEKFVGWAEKQDLPFVVLTSTWADNDVIKHQNSHHAAVAYLSFERSVDEIYSLFEAKATGTDGLPVFNPANDGLELEDYSEILAKPEMTVTSGSISLQLNAPTVVLGGESATAEVEAISFQEEHAPDAEGRTVLLDTTQHQFENSLNELPPIEDFPDLPSIESLDGLGFDDAPSAPPAQAAPAYVQPAPSYSVAVNQFSINPTPSGQVTDLETLRSYLALREQDVAVLSGQVRSSQERIQQLEMQVKIEKARSAELTHMVSKQEQQLTHYNQEKQVELDVLGRHIEDMDKQLKDRTDKARTIEAKLRMTMEEVGKVKERVRVDIRRIRVREKELESQLEIVKKDSSALLQARDEKILELKRKLDLLEFNMELVQEQFSKEKQTADELKAKLKDAAQVVKKAGGLLEQ